VTSTAFFYYFSAGAIVSALLTVGLRNPIYCTVSLLSALVHVAGLFVLLHAEFIFAIQIIIYAGAVLVLYLFVMMLLNIKTRGPVAQRQSALAVVLAVIICVEILLALSRPQLQVLPNPVAISTVLGNTEAVGLALFTDYLLPFEVVGIILLGGAVGALVLAKQISTVAPTSEANPSSTPAMPVVPPHSATLENELPLPPVGG